MINLRFEQFSLHRLSDLSRLILQISSIIFFLYFKIISSYSNILLEAIDKRNVS